MSYDVDAVKQSFETFYQGQAPWEINRPQPAFVELKEANQIRGSVLDVGCGTGENALYLAARGHEVYGIDLVPSAIEKAQDKARERGIVAHFQLGNALELSALGRVFDTIIDCGLFHTFGDEERPLFVAELRRTLKPGGLAHILCRSERDTHEHGPRRVTEAEIRAAFAEGFRVEAVRPSRYEVVNAPGRPAFAEGGLSAHLATIVRIA